MKINPAPTTLPTTRLVPDSRSGLLGCGIKIAAFFVFLFALLAPKVAAGGGLVSFQVAPTGPINTGEAYTLTPTVKLADGGFCKNCPIQIKLEDPQDSDVFNPTSDKTDDNGTMFVKVVSNISGNRVAYAEVVMPDGSTYTSSKVILNYNLIPVPHEIINVYPIEKPSGGPVVKTVGQSSVNGLKGPARYVNIQWDEITNATSYKIYLRPTDYEYWAMPLDNETKNSYFSLLLSSDYDYYVKVDACNDSGCISSREVLVEKTIGTKLQGSSPLLGDKKIEELNKKVESLEKNLAESQKKQTFLESQLSRLINFIKSVFPFFK